VNTLSNVCCLTDEKERHVRNKANPGEDEAQAAQKKPYRNTIVKSKGLRLTQDPLKPRTKSDVEKALSDNSKLTMEHLNTVAKCVVRHSFPQMH
jgi:hypothetical protein